MLGIEIAESTVAKYMVVATENLVRGDGRVGL